MGPKSKTYKENEAVWIQEHGIINEDIMKIEST
jgi:hypothetical protein